MRCGPLIYQVGIHRFEEGTVFSVFGHVYRFICYGLSDAYATKFRSLQYKEYYTELIQKPWLGITCVLC